MGIPSYIQFEDLVFSPVAGEYYHHVCYVTDIGASSKHLKLRTDSDRERWIDEWRDVVHDLVNAKEDFYFINKEIGVTMEIETNESFHDFTKRFRQKISRSRLTNPAFTTTIEAIRKKAASCSGALQYVLHKQFQ